MAAGPVEGDVDERILPRYTEENEANVDDPYIVILYNDDYHQMDEVVAQLQKATGYEIARCVRIMLEAHTRSRAVAYSGCQDDCERCAAILRQIRLQVETDRG